MEPSPAPSRMSAPPPSLFRELALQATWLRCWPPSWSCWPCCWPPCSMSSAVSTCCSDGKLYDAYVSYSDCPEDRKFVNFILKPQLERRRGYKLFLDDRDLLPRAEPSADLLVNLSRCRRLIVVLSDAFLSRAWCSHSFREGLCRLLELTRRPIFITFEGQRRDPAHPALRLLRQHRHLVTLLLWRPGSV
ncbi:SIGIRR isoform 12, partial [Pongo abelii]